MSRAKPTSLLAIKIRIFSILMRQSAIVFTYSHLFPCTIYCVTAKEKDITACAPIKMK